MPGPAPAATPRVVPATLSITRSKAADQAAINAQRVCKVSGEPLGSMGTPIKVVRGDRAIFLCCQSCVKRIQANPDPYLRSPVDDRIATARCPVPSIGFHVESFVRD